MEAITFDPDTRRVRFLDQFDTCTFDYVIQSFASAHHSSRVINWAPATNDIPGGEEIYDVHLQVSNEAISQCFQSRGVVTLIQPDECANEIAQFLGGLIQNSRGPIFQSEREALAVGVAITKAVFIRKFDGFQSDTSEVRKLLAAFRDGNHLGFVKTCRQAVNAYPFKRWRFSLM